MKALIKVGLDTQWAKVKRIDEQTYSIPLYICEVLQGPHKGETIATCTVYEVEDLD